MKVQAKVHVGRNDKLEITFPWPYVVSSGSVQYKCTWTEMEGEELRQNYSLPAWYKVYTIDELSKKS